MKSNMKKLSEKILYKGNWLRLKEATYQNAKGEIVKWESVERSRDNLAVVIVARLLPSNRFILIKQYRHTIDSHVIGFPAGIVNPDLCEEALEKEIIKELREETGYIGRIIASSPILKSSSGVMNSDSMVISMEIDEEDPINADPVQDLEPSEEISVIPIEHEDIRDFLIKEKKSGSAIGAGLWYLFGLDIATEGSIRFD